MADDPQVSPEQLCIGLYIHLDLGWMDHPFAFSSFKIKTEQQLETLRQLGLSQLRYDPGKSDCAPLPLPGDAPPAIEPVVRPPPPESSPAEQAVMAEKRARVERMQHIQKEIEAVEKGFVKAADALKQISRTIYSQPEEAFEQADSLVGVLAATALAQGDMKIHAMSQQLGEDVYFHSLNVAVLSMMLGHAVHLKKDELHQLGLGALFHDIGQIEIPPALLVKKEALNKPEQALFETHCRLGVKIAKKMGLSAAALSVIAQHHEMVDGSGYPEKLQGHQITLFARIVSLVNAYDNLCNPSDPEAGVTPYEALSQMFAKQRTRFDEPLLRALIRCLGVYPPGSLVQLSNDVYGLVMSVNAKHAMKPQVMVYDPEIPKEAALIVDLEFEPELKIARSLRASSLPLNVHRYLNPRQRVTYYFDKAAPQKPR